MTPTQRINFGLLFKTIDQFQSHTGIEVTTTVAPNMRAVTLKFRDPESLMEKTNKFPTVLSAVEHLKPAIEDRP